MSPEGELRPGDEEDLRRAGEQGDSEAAFRLGTLLEARYAIEEAKAAYRLVCTHESLYWKPLAAWRLVALLVRNDQFDQLEDALWTAASGMQVELGNAALRAIWILNNWPPDEARNAFRAMVDAAQAFLAKAGPGYMGPPSTLDEVVERIIRAHGGDAEVELYRTWTMASASRLGGESPGEEITSPTPRTILTAVESSSARSIFITARGLDAFWGFGPVSHLSLVLRASDGRRTEYEANPERQGPLDYGLIIVSKKAFRPRPDRHRFIVPLASGGQIEDAETVLDAEVARLQRARIAYNPFGPNSNTVVRTLLLTLGLEPLQPAAVAPGFEHHRL